MEPLIQRVVLDNWRSHAHLDVDLGMVTTITGPNRSGKTNILRAIRWALFNDGGSLDEIRSPGGDTVKVQLFLSNGLVIVRARDAKSNICNVVEASTGEVVKSFHAVGQGAIPDIVEMLGLWRGTAVDLHNQGEGHRSVVDLTPKEFSTALAQISGATLLDEAGAHGRRDLRAMKSRLSAVSDEVGELEQALKKYHNLPDLEEELQAHAQTQDKHRVMGVRVSNLERAARTLNLDFVGRLEALRMVRSRAESHLAAFREATQQVAERQQGVDRLQALSAYFLALSALVKEQAEIASKVTVCPTCGREMLQ